MPRAPDTTLLCQFRKTDEAVNAVSLPGWAPGRKK